MTHTNQRESLPRIAWTVAEVAAATGLGASSIGQLVRDGRLPRVDTGTDRMVIPDWALRAWIDGAPLPITHGSVFPTSGSS